MDIQKLQGIAGDLDILETQDEADLRLLIRVVDRLFGSAEAASAKRLVAGRREAGLPPIVYTPQYRRIME